MDLTETDIVKSSDERPARMDGTCFYCSQPMGGHHKPDCVIVSKTVVLRMTLDVVVSVPRHWTPDNIRFHRNEGSWCSDNILEELGEWAARDEQNCGCACAASSFEYVRDATADDHETLPLLLTDDK